MKNFIMQVAVAAIVLFGGTVAAQTRVAADVTANTTWTVANSPYILDGYVFVRDGATLTIDSGVVVRGMDDVIANNVLPGGVAIPSTLEDGSPAGRAGDIRNITDPSDNVGALIVTRTGNINAVGSASNPIIFTALQDDLTNPNDFTCCNSGFWGGLIILGNAVASSPEANFNADKGFVENQIEGVITTNPNTEEFATYGGNDDNDTSGTLMYVSIRHGGDVLTDGDEINGLTLGSVGRGTVIDFVEVIANADDGIEWFGGTVGIKHAIVTCVVDDSYDYDQGSRFAGQFFIAVGNGNHIGEHDGGNNPDDAEPQGTPRIFNATYIGKDASDTDGELPLMLVRDNAGANYLNSVFKNSNEGIAIEYRYNIASSYFQTANIVNIPELGGAFQGFDIRGNSFCDVPVAGGAEFFLDVNSSGFTGSLTQVRATSNATATVAGLIDGNDVVTGACITISGSPVACPIGSDIRQFNQGIDLRYQGSETADVVAPVIPGTPFFEQVTYRGAVDPTDADGAGWAAGWTATAEYGIID